MKHLIWIALSLVTSLSFAASNNFKPAHQYHCFSTKDSYQFLMNVNLNNFDNKIQVQPNFADVDRTYAGAPNTFRFVFEESDEGTSEALLQSAIVNGAPTGMMAIQTHGEDNTRTTYNCLLVR